MKKTLLILICVCIAYAQTIVAKKFIGCVTDAKYISRINTYLISDPTLNLWIKTDSTDITLECPGNKQIPLCKGDSVFIYTTEYERLVGIGSSMQLYKKR